MYNNYYVAIDFDGTLVEHQYPAIGDIKKSTIELLLNKKKELNELGLELVVIIWTCRGNDDLRAAREWCEQNMPISIAPKYYNENPEVMMESPKIFANEYWDDRALKII